MAADATLRDWLRDSWYQAAIDAGLSMPAHLATINATDALYARQLAKERVTMTEIARVLADETVQGRNLGKAIAAELPPILGQLAALINANKEGRT